MGQILIVEDDTALEPLLRLSMEHAGHKVSSTTSIHGARDLLRRGHPDLMVLDLSLPDGNGLEFLREIRLNISMKMPVIVLSGQRQEDTVVRGLELGANDYVRKPFAVRELMARIGKWV